MRMKFRAEGYHGFTLARQIWPWLAVGTGVTKIHNLVKFVFFLPTHDSIYWPRLNLAWNSIPQIHSHVPNLAGSAKRVGRRVPKIQNLVTFALLTSHGWRNVTVTMKFSMVEEGSLSCAKFQLNWRRVGIKVFKYSKIGHIWGFWPHRRETMHLSKRVWVCKPWNSKFRVKLSCLLVL